VTVFDQGVRNAGRPGAGVTTMTIVVVKPASKTKWTTTLRIPKNAVNPTAKIPRKPITHHTELGMWPPAASRRLW
jgi:hypothetical protein